MNPKRGDVWMADLGERFGHEQQGVRPVLILQNNVGNYYSPNVIAAAITDAKKRGLPTHQTIGTYGGLSKESAVLLEQIHTLDKRRLEKRLGTLPPHLMVHVDRKIKISLGLVEVPMPERGAAR